MRVFQLDRFRGHLPMLAAGLCSIALAAGCTGPGNQADPAIEGAGEDGVVEVRFDLTDFAIDAPVTTFETGVPYRFVIANSGVIAHDFRITPRGEVESMLAMHVPGHEHGTELLLIHETDLPPGGEVTANVTFSTPGEYEIACHVAGHWQAGMYTPIVVVGDALTEPDQIDASSITFDPDAMADMPCHAMGLTIMGDCSAEDIERIRGEILSRPRGVMPMSPGEGQADGSDLPGGHGHGDESMPGAMGAGMMDEQAMTAMMAAMMARMMSEGMMRDSMGSMMGEGMMMSEDMMAMMRRRIVFDLWSRRSEPCQIIQPNMIVGGCSPEEVAQLVSELMAELDEGSAEPDLSADDDTPPQDDGHDDDDDGHHDDDSGEGSDDG